ncbi:MAG: hypothetical protein KBD51_04015 [Candidatus Levybacteria bacterium]|nr:hypothetical protein [Candidatus Levybacteria bacterium]
MNDPRDFVKRNIPENNISLYLKTGLTDEYWRMHYAGLAMQGLLACNTFTIKVTDSGLYALRAFEIADAMLKQNKEPL